MLRLLQIEWLKVRTYKPFWILLLINVIAFIGFMQIIAQIFFSVEISKSDEKGKLEVIRPFMEGPFLYPAIWATSAFFTSFLVPLCAILLILNVCNEWNTRMLRQQVIEGMSRSEFLLAKLLGLVVFTLLMSIFFVISTLLVGKGSFELSNVVFNFALLMFSQFSLAFLLGLWLKRSVIALAVFLAYMLIAEPLLVWFLKTNNLTQIVNFLPLEVSDRIILPPEIFQFFSPEEYKARKEAVPQQIIFTILELIILWGITFGGFRKKDL